MNTICNDSFTASLRGLLCAGVAMAITASFSWTFTSSTAGLNWMGSSTVQPVMTAAISRDRARAA
jgi:ABC-type phosphate transport system substrate-binding protein